MKIILEAFGRKLVSHPMDVPEDTGPVFRMALTQPVQVKVGYSGDKVGEWGPIATMCEFEWTGETYDLPTGLRGIRRYVLRDISRI